MLLGRRGPCHNRTYDVALGLSGAATAPHCAVPRNYAVEWRMVYDIEVAGPVGFQVGVVCGQPASRWPVADFVSLRCRGSVR